MIKVAVVGAVSMGKNHVRVLTELNDVGLVCVAEMVEANREFVEQRYNVKTVEHYQDVPEDVDMVSIITPTSTHYDVAKYFIEKGKHVFIEKPIAQTLEQGRKLIDLANEYGVKLTVGHIERFNPAIIELKKRVDAGELGKVFKIDVNRVGPFPSRIRDVGVIIDLGVHDLDMIRHVTGDEAQRIYAETEKNIHTTNEDLLNGTLKLRKGTICNLNINWLTPTKIRKIYVSGEKGMFVVDYLRQDIYFYENGALNGKHEYADIMRGISEGNMTKFSIHKKEPLKAEIEHFIDCVASDKEPLVSGEDGLKALELAYKLIESAEAAEVVRL